MSFRLHLKQNSTQRSLLADVNSLEDCQGLGTNSQENVSLNVCSLSPFVHVNKWSSVSRVMSASCRDWRALHFHTLSIFIMWLAATNINEMWRQAQIAAKQSCYYWVTVQIKRQADNISTDECWSIMCWLVANGHSRSLLFWGGCFQSCLFVSHQNISYTYFKKFVGRLGHESRNKWLVLGADPKKP